MKIRKFDNKLASMNKKTLPADFKPTRRSLLKYSTAGLATVALSPWLYAYNSLADARTNTGGAPQIESDEPLHLPDLRFNNEVVVVQFGEEVREPFMLLGKIRITEEGVFKGRVRVTFPDGTYGTIRFFNDNQVIITYRTVKLDLLSDGLIQVEVNGYVVPLESVAEQFSRENNFTGIGPLSDLSRAFIIPVALGSAPAWTETIGKLRGTPDFVPGEMSDTDLANIARPAQNVKLAFSGTGKVSDDMGNVQQFLSISFPSLKKIANFVVKVVVVVVFPVQVLTIAATCAFCRKNPNFNTKIPVVGEVDCKKILAICDLKLPTVRDVIAEIRRRGLVTEPPPLRIFVDNNTPGFYNAALGKILDGTSELFPIDMDISGEDPKIVPAPAPDLSPAAAILGDWLSANPLPLNPNWTGPQPIPLIWDLLTETAIIYQIDVGSSATRLIGNFAIDNGIFVWVNGNYTFGAIEPGPAEEFEYSNVDLGSVPPGINYIQILREDHGKATGYSVQITTPPSGA